MMYSPIHAKITAATAKDVFRKSTEIKIEKTTVANPNIKQNGIKTVGEML